MATHHHDLRHVLADVLTGPVEAVAEHESEVRASDDADALHDYRVAFRRTRSLLRTFRPVLDRASTDMFLHDLRELGRPLGHVRDLDVQIEMLEGKLALLGRSGSCRSVVAGMADDRARARDRLVVGIDSHRHRTTMLALRVFAESPVVRPKRRDDDPAATVLRLAARQCRRLERAVDELSSDPDDEDLHEIRLLAKRARYACEVAAQHADPDVKRLVRRLGAVQDRLGDHQDAATAQRWLADAAAGLADRDEVFVLGEVAGLCLDDQRAARRDWPHLWERVRAVRIPDQLPDQLPDQVPGMSNTSKSRTEPSRVPSASGAVRASDE